jgi:hypothetical protein
MSEKGDQRAKRPAPRPSRKSRRTVLLPPRRPSSASAYTVFVREMHVSISENEPDLSFSERAIMISVIWAMMSPADRHPYALAAAKAELQSPET